LPANDSASFPFRFINVHSEAVSDRQRDQFFEVPFRQIHFKRRGKKRLPASIRDYDIAYFVAWRVETGKLMKNVKEDARYHFKRGNAKISKSTVDRAWGKHGAAMTDHVRGILSDLKKPYVPKKAPSS